LVNKIETTDGNQIGATISGGILPIIDKVTGVVRQGVDNFTGSIKNVVGTWTGLGGYNEAAPYENLVSTTFNPDGGVSYVYKNGDVLSKDVTGNTIFTRGSNNFGLKELVIYISMGFGNPYGDVWNVDIVEQWVNKMNQIGVKIISLSDTIGIANPESISYLCGNLISSLPHIEFGAHLHSTPDTVREKVEAAYRSGCRRFDGAIKGFGGCPMAADDLTGNMPTEKMIAYFEEIKIEIGLNKAAFRDSWIKADSVFIQN
jgi:hypothetical protein